MSDFTSEFWNWYIIGITLLSVAFCAWLLLAMAKTKAPAGKVQTAPAAGGKEVEITGHIWDGDLAEFNNPLPRWWMWLFWITIVFSLGYLVLYPGLGKIQGVLGWTSTGAYAKESAELDAKVKPLYDKYTAMDLRQVAADPAARGMGERIFLNNCAQCHGSDAGGARGFPSLKDADWLYGGAPETIKESVTNGRMGVMPALGAALGGDDNVKNVVAYVRSLSGLSHDGTKAQLGRAQFETICAACHGVDGKGNPAVGAPNLTDKVWLYGSSEATIAEGINKGRNVTAAPGTTTMPSFKDQLGPAKIHLVAAYVWSLSNTGGAAASAAAAPATAAPAPAPSAAAAASMAKVYFDSGKADLSPEGGKALEAFVAAVKGGTGALAITGYHDATGSIEQNQELAKQRAFKVRDALTAAGIPANRIELKKPEQTQGSGNDAEARRVEVRIL
jgi:cytochrome c oxidase cbb3-type subunit 3